MKKKKKFHPETIRSPCSHLARSDKHHSDLMGVIRRHLVQDLHCAVNHLPQRANCQGKRATREKVPGRPQRSTDLSFWQQEWLVGFIPKEGRVVELEEDEAGGDTSKYVHKYTDYHYYYYYYY